MHGLLLHTEIQPETSVLCVLQQCGFIDAAFCHLTFKKFFTGFHLCPTVSSVWRKHVWPRWRPTSWSACLPSCCPFRSSGSPNPSSTASSFTSQPPHLTGTRWWTVWPCCLRNRWHKAVIWLIALSANRRFASLFQFMLDTVVKAQNSSQWCSLKNKNVLRYCC